MNKNIVVLAMSTLPTDKKDVQELRESRFAWKSDDETGYAYFGQLEPISTMIREREGSLDKAVILATKDTREKKYLSNGKEVSAVDFYRERMNLSEDAVDVVEVEENDFLPAISKTVEVIREYWSVYSDNESQVKLWIDTQGGFRNISMVLNAVITLLEPDGIVPSGIYSMNYNRNNEIQRIVDQTNTYKIFQFVSGINEFIRSGRAEQLTDYYHYIGQEVPKSVKIMKAIAEAIQMCDMTEFDNCLRQFIDSCKEEAYSSEELMGIFSEQIKRDYGKLLEQDCTGLDVVEWFYHKGFYQQAITYIEAKLPKEWIEKGIVSYSIDAEVLQTLKKKLKKEYEKNENIVVTQTAKECFRWNAIREVRNKNIIKHNLRELGEGRISKYSNPEEWHNIEVAEPNQKKQNGKQVKRKILGTLDVTIHCKNKERVMNMILLYKLLKSERNNFNHMSENGLRASREELGEAIGIFLRIGRLVYEDIC